VRPARPAPAYGQERVEGCGRDRQPMARPRPLLGPFAKAGLDRVSGDVAHHPQQLPVVADLLRPVAALEQVPVQGMAPVEADGVDPVQVAHALVEVGIWRLDQEVVVVAHQAVAVAEPAVAAAGLGQEREVGTTIAIVREDRLAPVPPRRGVVDRSLIQLASTTSHATTLRRSRSRFTAEPHRTRSNSATAKRGLTPKSYEFLQSGPRSLRKS
jgi:hypothetical protein